MLLLVWGMADSMWKFLCTPNCPRSLSGGLGQESKIGQSKKRWELGNRPLEANPEERASPYDIQKRRVLWRLNVWYGRTMQVASWLQARLKGLLHVPLHPTYALSSVCLSQGKAEGQQARSRAPEMEQALTFRTFWK